MISSSTYIRQNITLAWPLAVNVLLVQSMLMIDTLLVAPLGGLPVAAMGIASTIVAFALGLKIAIGNGVQLLVGKAFGAKSQPDLAVAFRAGLFINLATAMVFLLLLTFFSADIVALITDNSELASLAESYIAITKYIILITAYTQVCTAFYNGRGNTRLPLKGYLIELPVNIVFSYLLINGYGDHQGLGLVGAAWGSLVAVSLRAVFLYLSMKFDSEIDITYPKDRSIQTEIGPQYAEIYPIAANYFLLSVGTTIYLLLYAKLPLFSYVAITLIFPWLRIGTQFVTAWAQASGINISQAIGQNQTLHLPAFISASTRVAMGLSVLIAGLFFALSQCLDVIYPQLEPETKVALAIIAPLYIILPIIRAYNSVSGNILRAIGESKRVLKVHFVTQWLISLPICVLLVLYFEVSVFWAFAMIPIEELLKTVPFYRYTQRAMKRLEYPANSV